LKVGLKSYWVKQSFVHHYRYKTFIANKLDKHKVTKQHALILKKKIYTDTNLFIENDVKAVVDGEPEKIIMTANISGVDNPIEKHFNNFGFNYIMFTDVKEIKSSFWDVRYTKRRYKDPRKEARMYKWLPHKVLPDIQYSLWVDSNIIIHSDIEELIKTYLADADIALLSHFSRTCIYDEAAICIAEKLDNPKKIRKHIVNLKADKYPTNKGLHQTRIILRRHTKEINALNEAMWEKIIHGTIRDQLSFNYVAWKLGVKINTIPGNALPYRNINAVDYNADTHFSVLFHIKRNRNYNQGIDYED